MATQNKLVTYEEAKTRIGVLPSCYPRPNAKNLRIMIKALIERLQGIPSFQSSRYGYMGFVVSREEYLLTGEQPWNDYPDPGRHRTMGGSASEQRDKDVRFNYMSNVYNSQENVRQATNDALTAAVPEMYRRAQGQLGPAIYTPTEDPRAILHSLNRRYGKRTPTDKEEAMKQWAAPWNPSEPIESMFFELEELYIQAVIAEVPYSLVQLLDQALDKIKKTGLYVNAVIDWNAKVAANPAEKTYPNLKAHFVAAYDAHLESGPTASTAGYHGAAAATAQSDDEDSLETISNSIAQM